MNVTIQSFPHRLTKYHGFDEICNGQTYKWGNDEHIKYNLFHDNIHTDALSE
eukprot:CAMPEP_0194078226 /NCGR_PEP_ID=MMETSP0149-20130528/4681_1 /TAXON_ID=122233 /ORGANISM="Chaetoceros debilis, Strain MM31A-1" /LENGTH=51 /DNA_ID=CAMNT_0038759447 /DNA_START=255 /DNA_END=410 /DNA_ORIENTATION=+